MRQSRNYQSKIKTLDLVLIILGIFVLLFVVAMIVIFCVKDSVPDTLIVAVMGSSGTESIMCALITLGKKKWKVNDDN